VARLDPGDGVLEDAGGGAGTGDKAAS
jgi:hypothetical protein